MAYSTSDDLLLGDLGIPAGFNVQRFVLDAADEIDSMIGARYVLPINMSLLATHSQLLLKRINNWLATGQIVISQAIGEEETGLHNYGATMLRDARALLAQVASGSPFLEGAVLVGGADATTGPKIINQDAVSPNAAFEDRIMRWHPYFPAPQYGPAYWQPGETP